VHITELEKKKHLKNESIQMNVNVMYRGIYTFSFDMSEFLFIS